MSDWSKWYGWLHGSDRIEYSGCRQAAEAASRRIKKLKARVAAGIAATNDKSEAYGLYAVGWNAALKHVRDVLENNDE